MLANSGLWLLTAVAVLSSALMLVGAKCFFSQTNWQARLLTSGSLLVLLLASSALGVLMYAFAVNDFSLSYVSQNSNTALAMGFKLAATWGGHQGSMLFWVWVLSLWGVLIAIHKDKGTPVATTVMMAVIAIFSWFTLLASDPFELNSLVPLEGRDLNPMLQDIGLIIHPPLLYIGYVGFASVLALAVSVLVHDDYSAQAFKRMTRHALLAWVFLTLGIAVGSWWAYYELGWGGWWFWDPVENASLMPWLTSTALLHALVVSRSQKQMLFWSLSLAIVTFCLSILGTFIVRSGVLTSVHAFAVDPSKGLTLLAMLSLIFIASYTLLVYKSKQIESSDIKQLASKNSLLLLGVNILVIATLVVVFGTFYPMIYQLLGLGNISVGAPYFNLLFAPLALACLGLLGLMPFTRWQGQKGEADWRGCKLALFCALAISISLLQLYIQSNHEVGAQWSWWAFVTLSLGLWVIIGHLTSLFKHGFSPKKLCVCLAHIGVALACIGASMNSFYSYEKTVRLGPELSTQFGDYRLDYLDTELYIAPSFTAEQGQIQITHGEKRYLALPEKRHYPVRVMTMTEPSMTSMWDGDIYITLGEKLDTQNYAVRVQFKAFVRWIGIGALMMVFAGIGLICLRLARRIPAVELKENYCR